VRVAFARKRRLHVGNGVGVEPANEPRARLAQHRLAAELVELEDQLSAFEWCRHGREPSQWPRVAPVATRCRSSLPVRKPRALWRVSHSMPGPAATPLLS